VRWRLLRELARGDRRVRELTGALDETQPLVSYHLQQLRKAELVFARRSSFDGRDSYYGLDLVRWDELLDGAVAALHPGLRVPPDRTATPMRGTRAPCVLFLCTGNSARSQIAEALLRERSCGAVNAVSAGSRPKPLHPNAVRVMRARGIDISGQRAKHLNTLRRRRYAGVITLCDRVREVCPEFPGQPQTIHWSIPDPAARPGSDAETYPAFERTAAELETRIRFLLPLIGIPTGKERSRS
jgi:protein-tyrosine-phosphatase